MWRAAGPVLMWVRGVMDLRLVKATRNTRKRRVSRHHSSHTDLSFPRPSELVIVVGAVCGGFSPHSHQSSNFEMVRFSVLSLR